MKGIVIILVLALCLTAVFCQVIEFDPPLSAEDGACFISEGTMLGSQIAVNCSMPLVDLIALQAGNVNASGICDNEMCFNILSPIYVNCDREDVGYAIAQYCGFEDDDNGSVGLHTVPVFALITALLAMVF